MRPFHTIAIPDSDILEGKFTMSVFAADIWETHVGRTVPEYQDPELFFKKTYLTQGLSNLMKIVESKLKGTGGDPVIQIQTPFGGGKTHALIGLYHKARSWGAKTVVFSGTAMSPTETIWGCIEEQLTGKKQKFLDQASPGREELRKLLEENQPALILIDELLEYTTKAATVPIKDSTLAAQTMAFMQELTEVAGILEKISVIITLPSSALEQYDRNAEKMLNQLQKISGRVERVYSPVQENEIVQVIRRRLFSNIDSRRIQQEIEEFMEYIQKEGIVPIGVEVSDYKKRFLESYPFTPEVVETLYHKWGSIPTFQRTRGVLRLLSLVINSLKDSNIPYISLADFDLSNDNIRREIIKNAGNEFDSVISADITNVSSGSKKVDQCLGKSFRGLKIATRAATSVFMSSFSGGIEKGCNLGEIIRSATTLDNPSSIVAEAVDQLKANLFFLQSVEDKYLFLNRPNLNRIVLTKIENIKDKDLVQFEYDLIKKMIVGLNLKVYLWPQEVNEIPDTPDLKLIILKEKKIDFMKNMIESKGETPRIYRNTLFFLTPLESEISSFLDLVNRRIAYEHIDLDKTLNLTEDQRKDVKDSLKKDSELLADAARRLYRSLHVPAKQGFKPPLDLGIPTYGDNKSIDQDTFDRLRIEEEILDKLSPIVIRERYLKNKDHIEIKQLYDSMVRTPGETRVTSALVIENAVKSGVKQGMFGLGNRDTDGKVACRFFLEDVNIPINDMELLLNNNLCRSVTTDQISDPQASSSDNNPIIGEPLETSGTYDIESKFMDHVDLNFKVPLGKVSQLSGILNYLQTKFQVLEIEIRARDGKISVDDFTNRIKEALQQLGIDLKESHN